MSKRKSSDMMDGRFSTKIKSFNLTYHWEISDIDKIFETRSTIKSDSFFMKNIPDLSWYFSLKQSLDKCVGTSLAGTKRHISLYLNCVGSNEALIKLSLKFCIVNSDGSHGYNLILTDNSPTESRSYGFAKFISHDNLKNLLNLYPSSNALKLFVEIELDVYVNTLKNPACSCSTEKQCESSNLVIRNSNFAAIFEKSDFSDLTIICENERIPVHRAVLAAKSRSFYEKLKSLKSNEWELTIAPPVVRELLSFMYTGSCPNLLKYYDKLLDAAEYCKMPDLKCLIEQTLIDSISLENATTRYSYAEEKDLKKLKDCTMLFINLNIQEFVKTDEFQSVINFNPTLTKKIICSIVEHFCTNNVDTRQ